MSLDLQVTPGIIFSSNNQPVGATELNRAATPAVTLNPNGGITPDYLDLAALEEEMGDTLRGVNYLMRPGFWTQDWSNVAGLSAPEDAWTENAFGWYVNPTGGAVEYNRVQDGPNTKTLYAVQLVGSSGVTSTDLAVWVPSCVAAQLRGESVTFSIYVKNMTTDPFYVTPFLLSGDEENTRDNVTEVQLGVAQTMPEGEWARAVFTIDANDYASFKNGFYIGLRTPSLTGSLKSAHFTQAQLEVGITATEYKRPTESNIPNEQPPTAFGGEDKITGGWLAVFLKNSSTLRYLLDPPVSMIKPALGWNREGGFPEWFDTESNIKVFGYTGQDQFWEVPAGITHIKAHAWGGGASHDALGASVVLKGGCGGYSWGFFPVTSGDKFNSLVGYGKHNLKGNAFGFGGYGQGSAHQHAGAGLSGLFTGDTPVASTDSARALLIAGGGGAGGQSGGGSNGVQGGNGNDPSRSGGMPDFQGNNSTGGVSSGGGGGGGGKNGGVALGLGGKGGTGYLDATATAGALEYTAYPSTVVPGANNANYDAPAGEPGNPGLIVVELFGPLTISDTSPLTSGTNGVAYSHTFEAVGCPTYTWSVTAGALPTGLTLSAGGVLSGTPSAAGTFNFTLQVLDGGARTASKAFTLVIA